MAEFPSYYDAIKVVRAILLRLNKLNMASILLLMRKYMMIDPKKCIFHHIFLMWLHGGATFLLGLQTLRQLTEVHTPVSKTHL